MSLDSLMPFNMVSALLVGVIVISAIAGYRKGAASSARSLSFILLHGASTAMAIFAAWYAADRVSPIVQAWLASINLDIPQQKIGFFRQVYYTIATSIRDFSMLRYAFLFIVFYLPVKQVLLIAIYRFFGNAGLQRPQIGNGRRTTIGSGMAGAGIGAVIGAARAILLIAVLFVYATLQPGSALTAYVQSSPLYQRGAIGVVSPLTGTFVERTVPVFTRAVEREMRGILDRKYEIIDAGIPDNIALAAKEITAEEATAEAKAEALYHWIGTRIQYDHEKVRLYEEEKHWLEQTPEHTFQTRKGVCIDYSRLYAVMARSVGLEAKVVTGLGYDGKGGYGPHAWNEVYLPENGKWIPLDSTWASSGGDWFNPNRFEETHIKDA